MSAFYDIEAPDLVDETKNEVLGMLNGLLDGGHHNVDLIRLPLMTFHVMQFTADANAFDVFRLDPETSAWELFGVRVEGWANDHIGLFREVTP